MGVKAGIERRHISLPKEQWDQLDELARAHKVPRYVVIRAVVGAGLIKLRGTPDMIAMPGLPLTRLENGL